MLKDFYRITIYVPILQNRPFLGASLEKMAETSPLIKQLIQMLDDNSVVGRVGQYAGVYEIGLGLEGYLPVSNAQPILGEVGVRTRLRTISFKTYVITGSTRNTIDQFVTDVVKIHPWEHPMIEISDVKLWIPD